MQTPIRDRRCKACRGEGMHTPAEHAEMLCAVTTSTFKKYLTPDEDDQVLLMTTQLGMEQGLPARDVP